MLCNILLAPAVCPTTHLPRCGPVPSGCPAECKSHYLKGLVHGDKKEFLRRTLSSGSSTESPSDVHQKAHGLPCWRECWPNLANLHVPERVQAMSWRFQRLGWFSFRQQGPAFPSLAAKQAETAEFRGDPRQS